jgi:hypothetical protein
MLRVTALVPDNQNANPGIFVAVDDRVREVCQRVHFATIRRRCTKAWMLLQQFGDSFELGKESPGQSDARFSLVEPN